MNPQKPSPSVTPGAAAHPTPLTRRQRLRLELLSTVESLRRRRADTIDAGFIEDYVALDWLEWHGGSLRLTVTGTNICNQIRAGMN
ncbi:hypothetical protein HLB44_08795 [Aquincola sp. S2]|uniref:Uncharacterized protein n=1 Tax=Pseudaquabacterium terrae TaxID=2732868 RepID=A0ABX2EEP2_9BURK|nr:hypothetical protein [Aquabacterium terrae]NRF67076.1 hypothetical protein [Aquabacterium terrae]